MPPPPDDVHAPPGEPDDSGSGAVEPTAGQDPGLRRVDYAGISPLTLPVASGFAFPEGIGIDFLGTLQDEAQRDGVGAWQGSFVPPRRWAARQENR